MKKVYLFIILLLILITITILADNIFTIRGFQWGATKEFIKNNESSTLIQEENNYLVYKTILFNENCELTYQFINNKLIYLSYTFSTHKDKISLSTYYTIHNFLIIKYGNPKIEQIYNDGILDTGMWIYESIWILNDQTTIWLKCMCWKTTGGLDYSIIGPTIRLIYSNLKHNNFYLNNYNNF